MQAGTKHDLQAVPVAVTTGQLTLLHAFVSVDTEVVVCTIIEVWVLVCFSVDVAVTVAYAVLVVVLALTIVVLLTTVTG